LFEQFPSYQTIGSKAYKPTLANTLAIVESLNNPQEHLSFIHVAGSNGKGSVCSMLASVLTEAGYKVGLFTSPHIKDYRERIRVNGTCIDEQSVVGFIQTIKGQDFDFEPSFFEVTFAMALQHFKQAECDICIIETGLGGRLDSTNIISPILSIITSISLEHTQILGNTLEEIATEKAGIIKSNTPAVLGNIQTELVPLFKEIAEEKSAHLHFSIDTTIAEFEIPLLGRYQEDNFRTVLKSCEIIQEMGYSIDSSSIQEGLNTLSKNTGFAGRLQIMGQKPLILFDVSHNEDGIKASLESVLGILKGTLHIVYGTSNDKDVSSILDLFPKGANFYFCEFTNERSMQLTDLKSLANAKELENPSFFKSSTDAFEAAKSNAKEEDIVLAIGSFFLISDFF
jgi:dihydrofolate synthase/folylpolyglutamate synthase